MLLANWKDYKLIDMHMGDKLERWGDIIVSRPDPQIIWPSASLSPLWKQCHMKYHRSKSGGGSWETLKKTPEKWEISWNELRFFIKPTEFKHMGLFPEQASNWERLQGLLKNQSKAKVLNLFGYTGGATVACASAGAHVTHLDASKGMVQWAKENAALSKVPEDRLRFISEDAGKFVAREIRRESKYDGIIMDPPSYGRGPQGELWKIEDMLYDLCKDCASLLSSKPLFFLINSYTTGFSPVCAENILKSILPGLGGKISSGEAGLPCSNGLALPCGSFALWSQN
ncbi:MAG: class I SAM-dependent methyltransferase [Clostridiales bacterium]|jgi:23S rRNA (cytosine1962-C5)-methyltransferase|nr:class I SAM-dependent methyltransferase [Clostridiales bacterium]